MKCKETQLRPHRRFGGLLIYFPAHSHEWVRRGSWAISEEHVFTPGYHSQQRLELTVDFKHGWLEEPWHSRTPHKGIHQMIRLLRVFSYEKRNMSVNKTGELSLKTQEILYLSVRMDDLVILWKCAADNRRTMHWASYPTHDALHSTSVEEELEVISAVIFHLSFSDSLSQLIRVQRI